MNWKARPLTVGFTSASISETFENMNSETREILKIDSCCGRLGLQKLLLTPRSTMSGLFRCANSLSSCEQKLAQRETFPLTHVSGELLC